MYYNNQRLPHVSPDAMAGLVRDPRYRWLLSVVKGFRNGLVYGMKIRFPHALVMTFLFHEGSLQEKLQFIVSATYQHARNLAVLTALYKLLTRAMEGVRGRGSPLQKAVAGAVCGYLVFGADNKINMQINLYLLSRVTSALAQLLYQQGWLPAPSSLSPSLSSFPLFAALMWGLVMWLYEHHLPLLQPSLQSSMTYIHRDSQYWTSLQDIILYNSPVQW